MGCDFYFSDISDKREYLKKMRENDLSEPSVNELFDWAREVRIGVHLKYDQSYHEKGTWNVRLWDLPTDRSCHHTSNNFEEIYKFIFLKLKEL